MIPENELKEITRSHGVPSSTIERDYAQHWLLAYLPQMALKGGTGLKKCYYKDYRFSDDLDFTLLKHAELKTISNRILNSIQEVRNESGINFLNQIKSEDVKNGYVFIVYFRILRTTGDPLKIKIDVTKKENEPIISPLQKRPILHAYSDTSETKVTVYSLDEIFAEKIRALFERTRPRDLYDIWYLSAHTTVNQPLLKKKFEYKNITPNFEDLSKRKTNFIGAWKRSLQHQIKNLPNPDAIFENVTIFLKENIRI